MEVTLYSWGDFIYYTYYIKKTYYYNNVEYINYSIEDNNCYVDFNQYYGLLNELTQEFIDKFENVNIEISLLNKYYYLFNNIKKLIVNENILNPNIILKSNIFNDENFKCIEHIKIETTKHFIKNPIINNLNKLITLNIRNNYNEDITYQISNCSNLKEISLYTFNNIIKLNNLPSLKTLSIYRCIREIIFDTSIKLDYFNIIKTEVLSRVYYINNFYKLIPINLKNLFMQNTKMIIKVEAEEVITCSKKIKKYYGKHFRSLQEIIDNNFICPKCNNNVYNLYNIRLNIIKDDINIIYTCC